MPGKSFSTDLKRVNKLGSAKSGFRHWLIQRITAIAMIPLSIWFVTLIITIASAGDGDKVRVLATPLNSILALTMLIVALYHGVIGIRVIIEDYVHSEKIKNTLLILLYFISVITAVSGICAILLFHLSIFALI